MASGVHLFCAPSLHLLHQYPVMSEKSHCPNCGVELKSSLLSGVSLMSSKSNQIISEYKGGDQIEYCTKCGKDKLKQASKELDAECNQLAKSLRTYISKVPIATIHSPDKWDYTVLGMVSGQSTTGTGVISEFTSSITDFFGAQSRRYNTKLRAGEEICFTQIRKQTLDLGGNAIIGTDIDYSELGEGKGMIMVCVAGTAVKLNNPNVLDASQAKTMEDLLKINDRFLYLNNLRNQ